MEAPCLLRAPKAPQLSIPRGRARAPAAPAPALCGGLACAVASGRSRSRRFAGFAVETETPETKTKTKTYGPREGFAAEKKLRSWLRGLDVHGVELLRLGRRSGVWLKEALTESDLALLCAGGRVLEVPRKAWIATEDAEHPEESLAAELLKEREKGAASEFQPYVDFLWRRDLAHHPMFWKEEEISWLSGCRDVQQAVLALQEVTAKRIQRLQQHFDLPEEELRFALCLVESRAITTSAVPGALVPILDHFRNDSTGSPALLVGDEGLSMGPMMAVALEDLEPGMELRNCFDSVSNQELFTQYGEVQIRVDEEVTPEVNAYNEVPLPIRLLPEHWKGNSDAAKEAKMEVLRRRAGIDLNVDAFLRLPMDALPSGRMLPLARFLQTPVPAGVKQAACEELFEELFKDCHPSLLGAEELWEPTLLEAPKAPKNAEELLLEVQARELVAHWYQNSIVKYNRMSERVEQELQDSYLEASSSSTPGLLEETAYDLAEVTNAYYKAKRKDGKTGKSRKAKECRVLTSSPSDGTVTVQFLENGVRHVIPEDWVVPKGRGAAKESSAKCSRGLLAMALLACQGSIIQACFQLMLEVLQIGQGILESRREKERAAMARELEAAWRKEYNLHAQCEPE